MNSHENGVIAILSSSHAVPGRFEGRNVAYVELRRSGFVDEMPYLADPILVGIDDE